MEDSPFVYMKTLFKEYFYPTKVDNEEVWNNSLIVLDTCALLNLYRYSENTRNAFMELLEANRERLWIPYQVAMEFLNDRREVINSQEKAYDDINKGLDEGFNKIESALNKYKKHVILDIEEIKTRIVEFVSEIKKDLQEKHSKHPKYDENDILLAKILSFYEGNVGEDFDKDKLNSLYKEGEQRYKQQIPPGYKDEKEKSKLGNRSLYGDLIVWKQIIKKASDSKCDIIFVTDDQKEDWWKKEKGKKISPRLELYKEFFSESNQRVLIYMADSFLRHANEYLKNETKNISEETIEEVRDVISKSSYLDSLLNPEPLIEVKNGIPTPLIVSPAHKQFTIYNNKYSLDTLLEDSINSPINIYAKDYLSKPLVVNPINGQLERGTMPESLLVYPNMVGTDKLNMYDSSIAEFLKTINEPKDKK